MKSVEILVLGVMVIQLLHSWTLVEISKKINKK